MPPEPPTPLPSTTPTSTLATPGLPAAEPTPEFDLRFDPKTRVVLVRPGHDDVPDVRVRRAFPWSMPDQYLSIRSKEGKELLLVRDLHALPADLQTRLREAIRLSTFIPRIRRVLDLKMQFGHQQWLVDTDRGEISFRVQEREDIKTHADGRRSVKDAEGNTYELPPDDQLDPASRKLLQLIL